MTEPINLYEAVCILDGMVKAPPMTDEEVARKAYEIFGGTVDMSEIERSIRDIIQQAREKVRVTA